MVDRGVSWLDQLRVTATFNGAHTNAQFDSLDELADEQGSPDPMPVESLRDEEQGAVRAEGFNLSERPLKEEKGILERHILVEKRRTWPQQDDQPHPLRGQQDLGELTEQQLQPEARHGEDRWSVQCRGQGPRELGVRGRLGPDGVDRTRNLALPSGV